MKNVNGHYPDFMEIRFMAICHFRENFLIQRMCFGLIFHFIIVIQLPKWKRVVKH